MDSSHRSTTHPGTAPPRGATPFRVRDHRFDGSDEVADGAGAQVLLIAVVALLSSLLTAGVMHLVRGLA